MTAAAVRPSGQKISVFLAVAAGCVPHLAADCALVAHCTMWKGSRDSSALPPAGGDHVGDLALALISAGCSVKAVQRALGSATTTLDTYGPHVAATGTGSGLP